MVGFPNHLESHELLPSYQSAYRQDYSTETLLLKIYNDILWDMEQQKISPFIAIDLSATFDTVYHGLLLELMQKRFGVSDTDLKWMESYLVNRNFEVKINESSSVPITVKYSVPQGSINGPIYFTCYCSTLEQCLGGNLDIFGYADDHGIRGSCHCNSDSVQKTLSDISTSLDNIKTGWLRTGLK